MNDALFVLEPQHVAGPGSSRQQGCNGILDALIAEVPLKGVARAQRQKGERGRFSVRAQRKNPVHNLVGGAIAAHGDESAITLSICVARDFRSLMGSVGGDDINLDSAGAQSIKRRLQQFSTAPATRRRIDHRKECIAQVVAPKVI
jgi:hypothetical protein